MKHVKVQAIADIHMTPPPFAPGDFVIKAGEVITVEANNSIGGWVEYGYRSDRTGGIGCSISRHDVRPVAA